MAPSGGDFQCTPRLLLTASDFCARQVVTGFKPAIYAGGCSLLSLYVLEQLLGPQRGLLRPGTVWRSSLLDGVGRLAVFCRQVVPFSVLPVSGKALEDAPGGMVRQSTQHLLLQSRAQGETLLRGLDVLGRFSQDALRRVAPGFAARMLAE